MKVLILRFSSIGDIVLTSPVIRSLKQARPESEIHFFTKPAFEPLLRHNPYLSQVHLLEPSLKNQLQQLKKLKFDYVLDLHKNLRTFRVKWTLGVRSSSFDKKNIAKYLMVQKHQAEPYLPHIVHRYGATLKKLGVQLDDDGLDLFLPPDLENWAEKEGVKQGILQKDSPIAVVLGANYQTKRWPTIHFIETLNKWGKPTILIGGSDARVDAQLLVEGLEVPVWNTVGKYDLLESAAILKLCQSALAHDTGFMHIAAAFKMKVYSLWGSTVPGFGMTPYQTEHLLLENKDISCRPCSKLGHHKCPQGHFDCMEKLSPDYVVRKLDENF